MLIFSMAVVSPFVISFFLKDLYHCWSLQPPLFFISLYTLYTALPNLYYDITGTVVKRQDVVGAYVTVAPTANNAVPGVLTPNSESNLATSLTYSPFLGITSRTDPNVSIGSITYDSYGRPQSSTSPYGAQTTYDYTYNPTTQKATTGSHWVKRTMDGLGRPIK